MKRTLWVGAALAFAATACGTKNRDFSIGKAGASAGGAAGTLGAAGSSGPSVGGTGAAAAAGGISTQGGNGGDPGSGGTGPANGSGGSSASSGCSSGASQAESCGTTCKPGKYECSSGAPVCNQMNADPGTTCGSNQVCDGNGSCLACTAGGPCGTPCKPGTYDCSTGAQVCAQKNAMAGATCGGTQVCDGNGSCVACSDGAACGGVCNPGTFDCSSGAAVCTNQQKKATGSACGANQVCDSTSNCVDCTANMACGTTCKPGVIGCGTGAPVCAQTNAALGLTCGTNQICNGTGSCVSKTANGSACQSGVECQSTNCSTYSVTGSSLCCQSGFANCGSCVNQQTDVNNCGSCSNKCGTNRTCEAGACKCPGFTFPAACGGGCGNWNFESGISTQTEGWVKDTRDEAYNGVQNVQVSATKVHDGSGALAIPVIVNNPNFGTQLAKVTVPFCQTGSTVNLAGFTLSFWVFFAGTEFDQSSDDVFLFVEAWSASASTRPPALFKGQMPVNTWVRVTHTFTTSIAADHLAVELHPGGLWQGTMYIDSVQITGL